MADDDIRSELSSLQRLEAEFSRFRSEYQRTREDFLSLSSEFSNQKITVQGILSDNRASLNGLAAKLDEKSKTNWQAVALIPAVVAGMWLFVTNYTSSEISKATSPLTSSTAAASKAVDQMSTIMTTLGTQINERARILESELNKEVGERRTADVEMNVKLTEIETQFCSSDIVRNLMHANDMRAVAILWRKILPDAQIPTDNAYYPMICHDSRKFGIH